MPARKHRFITDTYTSPRTFCTPSSFEFVPKTAISVSLWSRLMMSLLSSQKSLRPPPIQMRQHSPSQISLVAARCKLPT